MSKTSAEQLLSDVIKEMAIKGAKAPTKVDWTVHRVKEAENMVAYVVHSDVIYKDIRLEFSPFRRAFDSGTGPMPTDTQFRTTADKISRELYIRYKRFLIKRLGRKSVFRIKNGVLPRQLYLKSDKMKGGYDDTERMIYFNAGWKSKNHFESFQSTLKRPLEKIIKTLPEGNVVREYISSSGNYKGIQVAHAQGSSTTILYGLIDNKDEFLDTGADLQIIDTGVLGEKLVRKKGKKNEFGPKETETRSQAIRRLVTTIIEGDADLEIVRRFNPRKAETRIILLMPLSAFWNQKTGGDAGTATTNLREVLLNFGTDLFNIEGSPSHLRLLRDQVEALFLNKKVKTISTRTKAKLKGPQRTITTTVYAPITEKVRINRKTKADKGEPKNLMQLVTFLNEKLHDKIRQNMGKGGSRSTLNYRTGRFARSAKIQALFPAREQGAIIAKVKYMRRPYGVFELGGKLNPPKMRDPAGIFGRSIRQILQEHKIIKLTRVKVTLSG